MGPRSGRNGGDPLIKNLICFVMNNLTDLMMRVPALMMIPVLLVMELKVNHNPNHLKEDLMRITVKDPKQHHQRKKKKTRDPLKCQKTYYHF